VQVMNRPARRSGPTSTGHPIKESPPYLHDRRLLTPEDTVEFCNLILAATR